MTDVTLMVNNQKLNVHKNILASQSEYFDKMFTSNFKEQNQDKIEINIDNLNYETLKTFVQFFYTSTLNITESNVQVNIFFLFITCYILYSDTFTCQILVLSFV